MGDRREEVFRFKLDGDTYRLVMVRDYERAPTRLIFEKQEQDALGKERWIATSARAEERLQTVTLVLSFGWSYPHAYKVSVPE